MEGESVIRTGTALLGALLMVTPAQSGASLEDLGLVEGRPFPDIVLPAMDDGRRVAVSDFRGSKLVLHVFASW